MKKMFVMALVMMPFFAVNAQKAQDAAKVTTQEAFDYNRCSLSILSMNGLTNLDSQVDAWTSTTDFDGKFDMNKIDTKKIKVSASSQEKVLDELKKQNVGKQVLNYWFQYDGKQFNSKLMEERTRYNATDADVLKDNASKVKTLSVANKTLLSNSFVMVTGPTSVVRKTDKKGNVSYTAYVDAYVYQVELTDSLLAEVWGNWLDEEATAEQRQRYEQMNVGLSLAASVKGEIGTGDTEGKALLKALNRILEPLEKKIDKWQVVTSIYKKHPLGAKIGKKEGLKNSDRYRAFMVVEDENGNLAYKSRGYVRATKVIDNRKNATGQSECSNFYQISGRRLREGMFLKQKKDLKLSVGAYGNLGGYYKAGVDVDYLVHTMHTLGIMQYAGVSVGFDLDTDEKVPYIPIALNYGVGIHPVRILEILPSVGIGADYYGLPSEDGSEESEDKFNEKLAYFVRGGLKVGVQVWYPVQIFVRADYSYKFSQGAQYVECTSHKRFGKLGFGAGIRVNF